MTFTIKISGDQSGTVLHDYLCPDHGRFEADVPRASVPDTVPCPHKVPGPSVWRMTRAERRADQEKHLRGGYVCGKPSPWSPSAITCRVKLAEVTRGKVEKPPTPHALDTRDLAEGMPINEWRAKRDKLRKERRRKQVREMMR